MIAIIDYGMGNLRSVQKGFAFVGCDAVITSDPATIKRASKVVLPGVGAFGDGMKELQKAGLVDCIHEIVSVGKPFLGICLGMQLLFDSSQEHGHWGGLKLIPGEVKKIPASLGLKVPHMGWNRLSYRENPLFDGIGIEPYVYFVHSYYLDTPYEEYVIGETTYGMNIQVAVRKGNVYGCQFHPEKSGDVGLKILQNFGGL